jgi:hypothetical protein
LETTDECLIGYHDKILIKNNRIYVADYTVSAAIFVFDMNGKFLFKIARKGQGPGEYSYISDIDVRNNGDVYVYNPFQRKILIYNSVGKYLHDIYFDYLFSNFCIANNKLYISTLREKSTVYANLAMYDMTNKKTQFILTDKKYLRETKVNKSMYNFYYSSNDITYYSPKFSNIIFSLDSNGIRPAIGIKNLNIPSENVFKQWMDVNIHERGEKINESNYFLENVFIYEANEYILFKCIKNPGFSHYIHYNKNTQLACFIPSFEYVSKTGLSYICGSTGKEFFGVVNFNPDNKHHKEILESREELKNWKEDDNPVIVFFNPDM